MKKLTKKSQLVLYGCAGLGVNMLNLIVASYLCSALLTGGFDKDVERWTYLNRDLVVAALWGVLVLAAKIIDGVIDIPLSHFTDNLHSKWGKRKTAIVIGFVPMIAAYLLFLLPLSHTAGVLNTVWFAALLIVFYSFYTLTMLTYYATFAEVVADKEDVVLISNVKSVCDVVYFILGYALIPVFIGLGFNIGIVALLFLPLSLTMLIPMFMLKEKGDEKNADETKADKPKRVTLIDSIAFSFRCREFIIWLFVLAVMNFGLQLFLSGINEYFSTTGLNMSLVMASCFAPVPFTMIIYNKIVRTRGLGIGYRYILIMFSVGMALMYFCPMVPNDIMLYYAIGCGLIGSFSIGAFFSVSYTVPSHIAAMHGGDSASSMFFAIQGLFEGISAGLASGVMLVFLKEHGYISYMTLIVAAFCMTAFALSFLLPKAITRIGLAGDKVK